MNDLTSLRINVHRTNLQRYRHLLATELTDAEEQAALRDVLAARSQGGSNFG